VKKTKTELTPGPWRWLADRILMADHGKRPIVMASKSDLETRGPDGTLIPLVKEHPIARLIESAPDLLEACEAVVASWERGDLAEAARMCATAAKKARGQS